MHETSRPTAGHPHSLPIPNVGELVARSCRAHAEQPAVTSATRSISYAELEQRSNRVANALLAQGLARGDRVGIYLPNCVEIVEIEIACYKAGLIKAPFNARLSPREVGDIAANSDASIIVTTAARAEAFKPHLQSADVRLLLLDGPADSNYEALLARASDRFQPVDVHEHEVAVLHYTSGSSGVLKAAMQTFGNRLAQLRKFLMRGEGMQAGHVLGLVGPVTHASGMQMVPALCTGATIHLFSGFEPGAFMAEMQARRVTHTFMVPTMINMLLAEIGGRYRPLPDLQRLGYGAAPMAPARILQAMDVFGPILSQGYGAGETTSGVCGLTVQDHLQARASRPERLASCGRPFLESLVEVVDDEGRRVPEGEIGE
ncbi:AMP-binding protein, partial [Delftia tsuruhatensis]